MNELEIYQNYKINEGPISLEGLKVLYGANYFSGEQIVRLRINLGEYNEVYTNNIPEFIENLLSHIPSLFEHHCSLGHPGGFIERMIQGTLLGHVLEHVIIEIQTLAGMNVGFGKTRQTKMHGVYNVVYRFMDEIAGIYAGKAAMNLINSILLKQPFNLKEIIDNLIIIREKQLLGFSTQAIVNEATRRKIPYLRLDKYNLVQLGTGKYRKIIRATITGRTSLIAVETADNKYRTNTILSESGVPVPEVVVSSELKEILEFYKKINSPIVIKPIVGSKGKHVSTKLNDEVSVTSAFHWAREANEDVIAQEFVEGEAYRLLVIDFKFAAAVKLQAPFILGNGKNSIEELIITLNNEQGREFGDKGLLSKVEIDEETLKILEHKKYTLQHVLPAGEVLILKNSENPRLGGKSTDVTDIVHPFNKFLSERISQLLHLDVAGIDIITKDISAPITENKGKVIEVNAAPDFKMHINPTEGKKREVQKNYVEMLFPRRIKNRIPIISVTGTQGKSLAVEIIDNCLKKRNTRTGVVNSTGLYISGNLLKSTDLLDSKNQQIVLKDPGVDCAIFEVPVETILEYGLGYEFADYGIVLNVLDRNHEYLQYDHIRDENDVAYAKSVVAEQVYDSGFSILNADNPLVMEVESRLYSNMALFSKNLMNQHVQKLIKKGGIVTVVKDNNIEILHGFKKHIVAAIAELSKYNDETSDSILAAITLLYIYGISIEEIKECVM